MKTLKSQLASLAPIRVCFYFAYSLYHDFSFNLFAFFRAMFSFISDFRSFTIQNDNEHAPITRDKITPLLGDKTTQTEIEPIYFFQDAWAAREIFGYKPKEHHDIGSFVKTVAIISQFVPTTFIDIRPLAVKLKGLTCIEGSVLELPFKDASIESLSSLCVIEHIGLGRYGDPIDPQGSEKAIVEMQRVVKKNGHILFSVPIGKKDEVHFNAHRVFTSKRIKKLFSDCTLYNEEYILRDRLTKKQPVDADWVVGLYHFIKK